MHHFLFLFLNLKIKDKDKRAKYDRGETDSFEHAGRPFDMHGFFHEVTNEQFYLFDKFF